MKNIEALEKPEALINLTNWARSQPWWSHEKLGTPYISAHLAYFVDYVSANDKTYKNYEAAFRNCMRVDWGYIRRDWLRNVATQAPKQEGSQW